MLSVDQMLFPSANGPFTQFRCQSRLGRYRSGIPCAAYTSTPPRNAADFLELAENYTFLDHKLINDFNETMAGHSDAARIMSGERALSDWQTRPADFGKRSMGPVCVCL